MSAVTLWCCRGCDCSVHGEWPVDWVASEIGNGARNFCPRCQTDYTMHDWEVGAVEEMELTAAELATYPEDHLVRKLHTEAVFNRAV
jgi:hypothetical protein